MSAELLVVLAFGLNLGVPLGMPPLPPDPVMERVAPDECLYYLSCSGTATPDAKSANQTEQLLAEDDVQDFLKQLDIQIARAAEHAAKRDPRQAAVVTELPAIVKTLLLRPSAVFLSKLEIKPDGGPPLIEGGLVVDVGDKAIELRSALQKLEAVALASANEKSRDVVVAGVTFRRLPTPPGAPDVLWTVGKRHLMVTAGEETAARLVARMKDAERKTPAWLSDVKQRLPVERVSLVSYVNVAAALAIAKPLLREPQLLQLLDVSGLTAVRSFSSVAGFQGEGVLSQNWLDCGGKPAGFFNLVSDKPLSAADLKAIPSDATTAIILRMALANADQYVMDALGQVNPQAQQDILRARGQMEAQLGIKLQDDLLKPLGDVIAIFNAPAEAGSFLTGVGLTISLRNRERLAETQERLLMLTKAILANSGGPASLKHISYQGNEIHVVKLGPNVPITPAWCLSKDHLIVGVSPQVVKAILAPRPQAKSLAEVDAVAALLRRPHDPAAIGFQDTEQILTLLYSYAQLGLPMLNQQLSKQGTGFEIPELPMLSTIKAHLRPNVMAATQVKDGWLIDRTQTLPMIGDATSLVPFGAALLLPAVSSARAAARRNMSMNNLKQMTLAMHNCEAAYRHLPAAAICDKQGKPLLSWRVSMLPFVDENDLYKQFHLDEPWDSEHNLKLVAKIPQVYQCPDTEQIELGKTAYLAITGKHAVTDVKTGRSLDAIAAADGTSHTIMLVEARPEHAVAWTKPDDLPLDDQILKALRDARQGGFIAAFADGSVRWIEDRVPDKLIKSLLTFDGGEDVEDF